MDHFISRVADFKSKLPKIVRDLGFRKGIFFFFFFALASREKCKGGGEREKGFARKGP